VKDKAQYIEDALDHCSTIKLIIAYTGNGITTPAVAALNQLVNDNSLDEERLDSEVLYIDAEKIEDKRIIIRMADKKGITVEKFVASYQCQKCNPTKGRKGKKKKGKK